MKKVTCFLVALVMILALAACGGETGSTQPITSPTTTPTASIEPSTTPEPAEDPASSEEPIPSVETEPSEDPASSEETVPSEDVATAPTEMPTEEPATPAVCGHNYNAATCITPKTCSKCGATEGSAAGHRWNDATCTSPKTCNKCGITEGGNSDHYFIAATCSAPKTCSRCGITQGSVKEHRWNKQVTQEPTYIAEGELTYTCFDCGESYTEVIGKYNFNPEAYGNPYHIRSSENPNNFLDFSISGDKLYITGKIDLSNLHWMVFDCGTAREIVSVVEREAFTVELPLSQVSEKTPIAIYTRCESDPYGNYDGYIYGPIAVKPVDDGYCFDHSLVLENNINAMKQWIDPQDCLSDAVSPTLKALSESIVGDEKNEYNKMYFLNKWVAENIYYDYDYIRDRSNKLFYLPDEVYQTKRTVCEGYANLLKALLEAQGIPCIKVITYSTGVGTVGYFDESNYQTTESNHAHIEAYLASEDRWVIMDPTWDSGNRYENGEFVTGNYQGMYFDMSFDFFAYTHKILEREPQALRSDSGRWNSDPVPNQRAWN